MLLNIYILEENTVSKIEEMSSQQADDNMNALVREGGAWLFSKLTEVSIMGNLIKEMLVDMYYDESAYSLQYLNPYDYYHLPEDCLVKDIEVYGNQRVCFRYSSYQNLSESID